MKKVLCLLFSVSLALCSTFMVSASANTVGVSYDAYVQKIGWQPYSVNGAKTGTQGKHMRIEGLRAMLTGTVPSGGCITYKTYTQKNGWQAAVSSGAKAGTTGKSLRLEAFKMTLSGMSGYVVKYRAFIQKVGWQPWKITQNGTSINSAPTAGTTGKALRIEAIQIVVQKV